MKQKLLLTLFTPRQAQCKLLLLYFILSTCAAAATTRYVSTTGSSVPPYTTWATASDSIQKCINICNDGDTVIVANGIYKESLIINSAITLMGSGMDSCVIDGRGLSANTIDCRNKINIIGFNIIGRGVSSVDEEGIVTHNYSINIKSCFISKCADGIYFGKSSGTIDGVIMRDINTGVFTFCGSDTCKPVIKNSIIVLRNVFAADDGIINFYDGQPTILNNIIIGPRQNTPQGIDNWYVKRLVAKNNLIAGFQENINAGGIYDSSFIINNVLRDQFSEENSYASISNPNSRSYIRNNIITNNVKGIYVGSYTPNSDYNIFWNNEVHVNNGSVFGANDVFADPMFVKDTAAKSLSYDYHLQKYSPGIDAGDKLIQDVDGSRSDIGMYGGPGGTSYIYLNLPPKPPVNFHSSYDSSKIIISWNKYSEADFSHYNIYRSSVNNFMPDSINLYCQTDTSYFIDELPPIKEKLYYRVTAVDSAGNESISGEQIVITITNTGETLIEIVGEYNLYQNYPNPFNPATTIPFRIKERSYVKVMAYDIKGELITTLVNETKESGYYEVEFNAGGLASGIYLYRIEVIGKGSIPVYMDMKKMIYLK